MLCMKRITAAVLDARNKKMTVPEAEAVLWEYHTLTMAYGPGLRLSPQMEGKVKKANRVMADKLDALPF